MTPVSLRNGFLSGKYTRHGGRPDDARRAAAVGTPSETEYDVIDTLAKIAEELGATSAAVALAWLRTRPAVTSVLVGPRKLDHLEDNLAGLEVALTPAQIAALDQVSAPTLNYPADLNRRVSRMLMYSGATVDGEETEVYPPLLAGDRY